MVTSLVLSLQKNRKLSVYNRSFYGPRNVLMVSLEEQISYSQGDSMSKSILLTLVVDIDNMNFDGKSIPTRPYSSFSSSKNTLTGSQESEQALKREFRLLSMFISSSVSSQPSRSKLLAILEAVMLFGITLVPRCRPHMML